MPFDPKSKARYDPLSDRLRVIRHRLGETQEQMAFHFKVCKETYSRWERYMLPKHKSAIIGIKYVLEKLDHNRSRPRTYRRKHSAQNKKKATENSSLAVAADGQPGE
jgi:DNA-binding XRE family transcriptional regulator